ncbi:Triosephosphate isomerase [Nymphaea thermarum]|nr:Triosephosphate isomerase [Nymphaea thermarum]
MASSLMSIGNGESENGTSDEVKKIVLEVVVSPPYVFLPLVKGLLGADFSVAAQNCWVRKGGAFTGEISAEMLVSLGIPWVILGHSERRLILNEANERKCQTGTMLLIAYEPVWAIGTGKVATPAQAQEVHSELWKWLAGNVNPAAAESTRIIYRDFQAIKEALTSSRMALTLLLPPSNPPEHSQPPHDWQTSLWCHHDWRASWLRTVTAGWTEMPPDFAPSSRTAGNVPCTTTSQRRLPHLTQCTKRSRCQQSSLRRTWCLHLLIGGQTNVGRDFYLTMGRFSTTA